MSFKTYYVDLKGENMSLRRPVNLLTSRGRDDCNIFLIKNLGVSQSKQESILQKLAFMPTFEELSQWIEINSGGENFIADFKTASDADRLDCLFKVQEPLALALKDIEKRRKNGRDKRLLKAVQSSDYTAIANILASAAGTYWRDHGFFNNEKDLKVTSYMKNEEKNQQKKDFQKAQLDHIGAAVGFRKARKKKALQEIMDFEETEEIINNLEEEMF